MAVLCRRISRQNFRLWVAAESCSETVVFSPGTADYRWKEEVAVITLRC
jgi:hypothetical protein